MFLHDLQQISKMCVRRHVMSCIRQQLYYMINFMFKGLFGVVLRDSAAEVSLPDDDRFLWWHLNRNVEGQFRASRKIFFIMTGSGRNF